MLNRTTMKISYTSKQLTFAEMQGSLSALPKTNRWVQMGDTLPWDEFDKFYLQRLKNDQKGAPNKNSRMVIGALIIKHKMSLSDEETILTIQENPYMQYMVGLTEYTDKPIFDPSLFVTIRKRLKIDDLNAFTLELAKIEQKIREGKDVDNHDGDGIGNACKEETQHTDIKVDATCCDAEMKYPTDLGLLDDASRFIDRMINFACKQLGCPPSKTERSALRVKYLSFTKKKHKGAKARKETMSFMLAYLHKDIMKAMDLVSRVWNMLRITDKRTFKAVLEMYNQQNEMFKSNTNKCPDRIVSIFQPHVRPIVRGKAKAKTEFGAKIGVSVVDGYTYIDHHSWDAYNECNDLDTHLTLYTERFNIKVERFFGDKIYLNAENRNKLKELGIKCMGPRLGRPPKVKSQEQKDDERIGNSLRNEVEATFGTSKRVYRANCIRAKLPETAASWTGMCYFVKNLAKYLRVLCHVQTVIALLRHITGLQNSLLREKKVALDEMAALRLHGKFSRAY